jgi:20S proteasome subunit beta 1
MGTTLMAICDKNGVIVASDSQTSSGFYISNRAADKITIISKNIICLRSGSSADTQNIIDLVKNILIKEYLEREKLFEVRAVAQLLRNICYKNKTNLNCGLICAGWDTIHGGQIYAIIQGGTIITTPFLSSGSGSVFINSFCDANYKENMEEQESEQFIVKSVSLAIQRDGNSSGIIRICKISRQGISRKAIFPSKVFN